jgi:hypothetical protein
VTGTVSISPDEWQDLRAGQRGSAVLHPAGRSLATGSISMGRQWISRLRKDVFEQKKPD